MVGRKIGEDDIERTMQAIELGADAVEDPEADEQEPESEGPADQKPATIRKTWPKDEELPTHYQKPRPIPCRKCRAVRLDTLSRAVAITSIKKAIAYFRCRLCGHRFSMPVSE